MVNLTSIFLSTQQFLNTNTLYQYNEYIYMKACNILQYFN